VCQKIFRKRISEGGSVWSLRRFQFLCLFWLLLAAGQVNGATIYSNQTGNWNAVTTWVGGVIPAANDDVIINGADVITINITSAICKSIQIGGDPTNTNAGTLTFANTGNPKLTVVNGVTVGGYGNNARTGTITFSNGSTLDAGSVIIGNSGTTPAAGIITMTAGGTLITGSFIVNTVTGNTWTPGTGTVNLDAANTLPATIITSFNNLTCSAGKTITGVVLTINGNLRIRDGATFDATGYNLTVTGTTNVGDGASGNMTISSATGAKLFTGLVSVAAGGTWNNSANEDVAFRGGITNSGTFNSGTGVHTFNTNSQVLTGTFTIPSVTITGVTLTNNNSLTIATALIGTGGLTQAANADLYIGGTSGITTLTATNSNNTVIYNGGNQTVHSNNYNNITLSGSGTKTLQTGTTNIGGDFTVDGVATSAVIGLTIGGDVILNNAFNFTGGTYTHNVAGNWTKNGWGTFTPGTGTINFTGNNSAINGTNTDVQTFNNITIAKTSGQTLSVGGSITTLNVNGDLTLASGAFAPGTIPTAIGGNWINNGGTLTSGTGIISMKGSGKTIGGTASTSFNNLDINNNAGGISLGFDQFVNGTLSLSNGLLKLGSYNLTIGLAAPAISGSFYSQNMIIAVGSGELRKQFSANGSYVFPIGDGTTVSPMTLNFTQGTYDAGAYTGVRVTNSMHPQNASPNYLKRYWSVSQSGIHSFLCNVSGNYIYADLVGAENIQNAVEYTGSLPWLIYSPLASYTLNANGVDAFGDFTGVGLPSLSTSVSSLDGFTYIHYYGPTAPQNFKVTAQNLSSNLTVTSPADFEISTSYSGTYSSTIQLTPSSGAVNSDIYVRLKAGLSVGTYSGENIICSTTGLSPVNVLLTNATVTAPAFCTPTGDGSAYSITLVKFGTINNITAKPAGYSDYTSTQSTNLLVGNTYQITVNANTNGNNPVGAKVWIDWNNGGFSYGSGYLAYDLGTATNTANGKTSLCPLNITVPAGASPGNLRMRVACAYYNSPYNACDNNSEVEDYTLNIIDPRITTGTITGSPFCTGASMSVPFTIATTFLAGNVFTAQLSDISGSFSSPVNIGTLTSTTAGTISSNIPIGSANGTGYRIRVVSSMPALISADNGSDLTIGQPSSPSIGDITQPTCAVATGSVVLNGLPTTGTWSLTRNPGGIITTGTGSTATISGLPTGTYTYTVTNGDISVTCPGSGTGLIAEYYNNMTLTGTPALTRTDPIVNFTWGNGSPDPVINNDNFSARWTGKIQPCYSETYTFTTSSDDGIRLWVNGTQIINNWTNHGTTTDAGSISLTAGQRYDIILEYYESGGGAVAQLSWNSPSQPNQIIPQSQLYSIPTGCTSVSSANVVINSVPVTPSTPTASVTVQPTCSAPTGTIVITAPVGAQYEYQLDAGAYQASTTFPGVSPGSRTVKARLIASPTCISSAANLTVNALPSPPAAPTTGAITQPTCALSTGSVVLSGLPATGTWIINPGNISGTGTSKMVTNLSSGTYNFTVTNNAGCTSTGTSNVVINSPTLPTIIGSSGSRCGPGTVSLGANASAGTINWYDAGGTFLTTGATYTTPNLSSTTTYYIDATSGSCTTPRTAVLAVIISPATISVSGAGNICLGSTLNLTSIGAGITNQYWQGPNGFYSLLPNVVINNVAATDAGTYTVTGSALSGINLVANGDFELGNIGFGTSYTYVTPVANALYPEGDYTIVADPHSVHTGFDACPNHTATGTLQMVVNGAAASKNIWTQTVNVVPYTDYQFTYWVQSVNPSSPSQSQLYVNDAALGASYTADATTCTWKQFVYNWNSGTSTTAKLDLRNLNYAAGGNDFAIDDIIFQQVCPATASGIVTIVPPPTAGAIGNAQTICRGYTPGPISSTTAGTNVVSYEWQSKTTGSYVTIPGEIGATYQPPALYETTSYQRRTIGTACNSVFTTPVTITVNGPWSNPGGPDLGCQSASPVAMALSGATVSAGATTGAWSIISGGGSLSSIAQTTNPAAVTYTPVANYSGTVILQLKTNTVAALGNCDAIANRTITFRPIISAGINGTATVCQNSSGPIITFTNPQAFPVTITYNINGINPATINIGASTTATVTAPTTTAGTFNYNLVSVAYQTGPACSTTIAGNAKVTVNVTLPVSVSIAASANPVCYNTLVTFTATPTNGGATPAYQWKVNGANVGTNSATYAYIPVTGDQITCVLTSSATPCISGNPATSNTVSMTFSPAPTSGTLNPTPAIGAVCAGTMVSAIATTGAGGAGTISDILQYRFDSGTWTTYTSGTILNTTGHTSIDIQTFRTATGSGCPTSATAMVSWTINAVPTSGTLTPNFAAGEICAGTTLWATAAAGSGGAGTIADVLQYRFDGGGWLPYNSGSFLSTMGHSSVDIQTYRTATGSNCTTSTPNIISWTVNTLPAAPAAITGTPTVCVGLTTQLSDITSGGTWTSASTGVATISSTGLVTGIVAGTSLITYTVTNAKGCISTATQTVTVNALPPAPAAITGTATVCIGSTTQLSDATAGGTWSSASTTMATINASGLVTGLAAGTSVITYSVTNASGCINSTVQTVTITPTVGAPIFTLGATSSRCRGAGTVAYTSTATNTTGITYTLDPASTTGGNSIVAATGVVTYIAGWSGSSIITASAAGCSGPKTTKHTATTNDDQVWTGAVSTNWNISGNWSCGYIPELTTNVQIPNVVNKPILNSGVPGMAKNIGIDIGSSLTVTGNTLQIAGTIANNGTFTATAGTIEMIGSAAQTIGAGVFAGNTISNLTISNPAGVTLSGPLNVTGIVTANGNLSSGGNLTLVSSATQTALIAGTGTGNVTGNVTMQRYLPSGFGYKYISSPFQSATVSEFSPEVNLAAAFETFYSYNENNSEGGLGINFIAGWVKYITPANSLIPMAGYAANFGTNPASKLVDATGVVNNGNQSITLSNHNRPFTKGFNLVGNPYPSPINWDQATDWTRTNVDKAIWLFNASTTDQYGGVYSSYVNGVYTDLSTNTTATPNIIPSMQGFFVHVTNPGSGTLSMTNKVRIANLSPTFKSADFDSRTILRFAINFEEKNSQSDGFVLYFDPLSTMNFEGEKDAVKMMNTDLAVPNLYSITPDIHQLSISAIPSPVDSLTKIPLGVKVLKDGWANFNASDISKLPSNMHIYLIDAVGNITQDLKQYPTYRFYLKTGEFNQRFNLVFALSSLDKPVEIVEKMFTIIRSGDRLYVKVNLPFNTKGDLLVTNIAGQTLLRKGVFEMETVEINLNSGSGLYIVTMISGKRTESEKILIRKDYE